MPADTLTLQSSIADLKLVYRVLHRHLAENLELMECELFEDMQRTLQERAKAEGVDVTDHAAWDAWLGNAGAPGCEARVAGRRSLS